jgi:hypothetical protein
MAADNNSANEPPVDPLTAPSWMFEQDDDILLAPPLEEFFSDVPGARSSGPTAPPPKIDDIITGGYTGWVPIIRAGESLAQAEARAEQAKKEKIETSSVEVVEVIGIQNSESNDPVLSEPETPTYVSAPIVDDPDLVTSPAQALDQARKRIAAMRASLQLNLNQVAESFAHPIFTPPAPMASSPEQTIVSTGPSAAPVQPHESLVAPVAPESVQPEVTAIHNFSTDANSQTATTPPAPQVTEPTFEIPQATRFFTPTESQTQPESDVQAAPADHSLELMIMRDEIKDLRNRLDASQKLIEELMHRLANLAELALKR